MAQIVIEATAKHTATIIFSHGLGDTAAGWAPFAASIKSRHPHVKWILPTASNNPVTLNGGMKMPSWFDIRTLTPPSAGRSSMEDEAGMLASAARISALVSAEVDAGIAADRIIIGGFSQGAVIALLTGITSERKLAGLISLSGFLGLSDKIGSMQSERAKDLPIFWGHGTGDQVVRYAWGQQSRDRLVELGFKHVEFNSYPGMGHSLCDKESDDVETFIRKVLPAQV